MAAADLKIIIAGSGIAGLSAAIGLELAGFDYTVLEQTPTQEPSSDSGTATADSTAADTANLGGAVQVGPTALHFLNQLGIYDELQKISKPVSGLSMNEHDLSYVGRIDHAHHRERYGYHTEVMARSQLRALLLQRIPPRRIVTGKVLGMIQDQDKVTVRCSDGTTYEGDVLIGADGAFSNVRHALFWALDEKKQLPKADTVQMAVDLHTISGCTKPLDPTKYPVLLDAMAEIQSLQLPDKPYTLHPTCHKGFYQPVSEAIADAVTLVNTLSTVTSGTLECLTNAFKDYRDQRAPTAKTAVEQCGLLRQVFTGKGRAASLRRNVVFNYMPEKVRNMLDDKRNEIRPQLQFLPLVKDKGIVKPATSVPLPLQASTPGASEPAQDAGRSKTSIESKPTSSASTSAASSPRNSRSSWSTFSRPAFSMPSAPNVPLFGSSTSPASKLSSPRQSTIKSSRVSVSHSKEEKGSTLPKNVDAADGSEPALISASASIAPAAPIPRLATTAVISGAFQPGNNNGEVSSDEDEVEFVNCDLSDELAKELFSESKEWLEGESAPRTAIAL
ncbi:hypothetical protein KVV02_002421 [Mortierella alpina]|uniref:FAD-binding domain-containing protein n=1 Tax=Mortierella alpina TaxID=64518 RepID=A0A9P8CUU2_MORAP|nr:hypothetical protein KVV02_002421 [Mortierella alpina]